MLTNHRIPLMKTAGFTLLAAIFCLVCYRFLSEGGYALAAFLSGGSLLRFDPRFFWPGQGALVAGAFSPAQRSLLAAAGLALPLVAWFGLMILAPKKSGLALALVKIVSTLAVLAGLLPWLVVPLLVMAGRASGNFNATSFVYSTGLPPLVMAGGALVLLVACLWLARRALGDQEALLASARVPPSGVSGSENGRTMVILALLTAVCLGAAYSVDNLARLEHGLLPPGFQLSASFNLNGQEYEDELIYAFHLDQARMVEMIVAVDNIDTRDTMVSLHGPEHSTWGIFHASMYKEAYDHVGFRDDLLPGDYQVVVESKPATGMLRVYTRGVK